MTAIAEIPTTEAKHSAAELYEFVQRQARARPLMLDVSPEGDGRQPIPVHRTGAATSLPTGLHRLLADRPYPQGRVEDSHSVYERLMATLAASGPQRFEVRSAVNPHRAYPSAHCFFAAQVFVLIGDAAWHFDSINYQLVSVTEPARDIAASVDEHSGASLVVAAHLGSIAERYQDLRWALSLCEAGHLGELLTQVGRAHGFAARNRSIDDDDALLNHLGLAADDGWIMTSAIDLGDSEPPVLASSTSSPQSRGPSLVADSDRDWESILFHRSAGQVNKGLTCVPDPLPPDSLESVGLALTEVVADTPEASDGGLDIYLVSQKAVGVEPGLYRLSDQGQWELRDSSVGMDLIQRAFHYPRSQMSVISCQAALLFVHDHEAQLAVAQPNQLRRRQVELGAAAQSAGFAMSAVGGFLRPARSFDPDLISHELGLPPGQLPGYLALLGVGRYRDLVLDVRP